MKQSKEIILIIITMMEAIRFFTDVYKCLIFPLTSSEQYTFMKCEKFSHWSSSLLYPVVTNLIDFRTINLIVRLS